MSGKTLSQQSEDGTAIEIFGVTHADVETLYPGFASSLWPNPPEHMLADGFERLVYVHHEPDPEVEYGDAVDWGNYYKDENGRWWRERLLVQPNAARLAQLKQQLREEAHDVAEAKLSTHFAGPHPNLGAVQRQGFEEVARYDARGTGQAPQEANFPVLRYVAATRSRTLQQQVDDTRTERDDLWPKAGQIWAQLITTLAAIDGAATAPEARAALDTFAEFEPV